MGSDPAVRSTVREACPQAPARPVAIKGDGAMRGMDGERADPAETLHRRILAPQSRVADPLCHALDGCSARRGPSGAMPVD